ncbi:condensation domain-containing protein, partial [Mycetohabitans endofungorum]
MDGTDGPELVANWTWAGALFTAEQIQELAQTWFQALEALVAYAAQPHVGGLTPSDVPLVKLNQEQIEQLEAEQPEIEEIWPLSPLQKGLLFHALYDPQSADAYVTQLVLDLEGAVDGQALRHACQTLLQRHANLRASFVYQGLDEPVQVIARDVQLPWQELDLSGLSDAAQEAECARFLQEDGSRRFELRQSPSLRFSLIRLTACRHRLVLTCHHILMDGWSGLLFVQEMFELYANSGSGRTLPRVAPYRDYLIWLKGRDYAAAKHAWQSALAGLDEATRLAPAQLKSLVRQQTLNWDLPESLTYALTQQARQHRLTLNTLIQGAWGLLLSHLTARDDVVFGVTVSGRPPELPGVEHMIGLLINTLPLRLQASPKQPIADLLTAIQDQQTQLVEYQYLALSDIQRLTGLGELFDTLIVFENYPVNWQALQTTTGGLQLTKLSGSDTTHYSLSLVVAPGARLSFHLGYRCDLFNNKTVEQLMRRFNRLLEAIAQDPGQPIGGIELLEAAERQQLLVEWNATERAMPEATLVQLFEA